MCVVLFVENENISVGFVGPWATDAVAFIDLLDKAGQQKYLQMRKSSGFQGIQDCKRE
jgi:hypothetical protein